MSKEISALFLVERTAYQILNFETLKDLDKLPPPLRTTAFPDPFLDDLYLIPVYSRAGGGFPVRAFLRRGDAEAFAEKEERAAWERINPFYYGNSITAWTSLDHGRLCDWLLDIGLEPPKGKRAGPQAWRARFDAAREGMSDLHLLKIREALDRVRLSRVAELTEEGTRVEGVRGRSG